MGSGTLSFSPPNTALVRTYFALPTGICYEWFQHRQTGIEQLADSSKEAVRARADLRFKKAEEAATLREKAMAEYAAESEARKQKTSKLRELRLAKEAEDQAASEAAGPAKKPARGRKK